MKSLTQFILEAQNNYNKLPSGITLKSFNSKNAKQTHYVRSSSDGGIIDTLVTNSEDVINVYKPIKWTGEKCFEQWTKCVDPKMIGDCDFYDNIDRAELEGFDERISMNYLKESKWTLIPYWWQTPDNLCILGINAKDRKAFKLDIPNNNRFVDREMVKKVFGFDDKKFLLCIYEKFSGWSHASAPNLDKIYEAVCFAMKSDLK